MASSSSSSSSYVSCTWKYCVFASFHGKDVRKTFLSHLRRQFNQNGISMFDDEGIERSKTLPVALKEAIRESRIAIVILSEKYASSSWCLKELVEILKCKEDGRQIVMTVFHGVDPSDVRNQTGDFGIAFRETCARNTEEESLSWSQALTHVGNIAGEHFQNWVNEAEMIEKIAKDVLDKRNVTPSRDFDGLVGIQAHLREMESLLDLDFAGVKVVAISGPAGIGKTTIARALQTQLSDSFQLTCFVDNLRGSCRSGFDVIGSKLRLQEKFLSKILNYNGLKIGHLDAVRENLCDQKVLIILDDVDNLNQLEALANETTWFGRGSRIVITTENKELLQQHYITDVYDVKFPSEGEAVEIFCVNAFKQSYPHKGFEELSERVTWLCGNLPLALGVVGSSLRGKKEDEWEDVVKRLEIILDGDIKSVLQVGYESLDENEKMLFLHIAVFFDREDDNLVKAMFEDDKLEVNQGLKILVYRSLIEISKSKYEEKKIKMHKLLQQMARQVIGEQDLSKRKILMDADDICHVLQEETDARVVSGISFDISRIEEVCIGKKAFKRMPKLRFLRVYKSRDDGNNIMHIPAEMEFPRRLRLLDWEAYTGKCLPPTFRAEKLVKLCMRDSQLEYLWQGAQKLTNLKKMDLSGSFHLKKLPDLSHATNLEDLQLSHCESLKEIPSSFSQLKNLRILKMKGCINLKVVPPHLKLPSLQLISMKRCLKLRNVSFISTEVVPANTEAEDGPALISRDLTYLAKSVYLLDLSHSDIERIPHCFKALRYLYVNGCTRLVSLPELPGCLSRLLAEDCVSLETVSFSFPHDRDIGLDFTNCFKLGQQARREIIQRSFSRGYDQFLRLPGREVPAEFNYRNKGYTLTIPLNGNNSLSASSRLKLCVVMSPNHQTGESSGADHEVWYVRIGTGDLRPILLGSVSNTQAQHLYVYNYDLGFIDPAEVSRKEISLVFFCLKFDCIECGAYICPEETIEESYHPPEVDAKTNEALFDDFCQLLLELDTEFSLTGTMNSNGDRTDGVICEPKEDENLDGEERTDCWSWLFHCFHLSR